MDLPTLVITGLQDHIFLDHDDLENLFSRLPQGRRIDLKNAGHLIPAERPKELGKAIIDFVKAI
jgi:pimeloyl-ACP methyl ester carboxylesterase